MTSPWQRLDDMPREGDRDEPVTSTPDEQRIGLQPAQAGPEAVLAVGFLQVDMARRGVEGRPPGRRQGCAQELGDARRAPAFTPRRDEAAHDRLDDQPRRERDKAELRAREPEQRGPWTLASPRQ